MGVHVRLLVSRWYGYPPFCERSNNGYTDIMDLFGCRSFRIICLVCRQASGKERQGSCRSLSITPRLRMGRFFCLKDKTASSGKDQSPLDPQCLRQVVERAPYPCFPSTPRPPLFHACSMPTPCKTLPNATRISVTIKHKGIVK